MFANDPNVLEIGRTSVRILVPSRHQKGGIVDKQLRDAWESRTHELLQKEFGGATPSHVIGSFVHEDGRVTREEITVLSASCSVTALSDEASRERVLRFGKDLCAAMAQESVFIGWGDTAYVVSASFDPAAIPVLRFRDLPEESQVKHLTMGWSGIDDVRKVVQVLSLDTWVQPPGAVKAGAEAVEGLTLRAELDEPIGLRRAWSWRGDLPSLRAARTKWSKQASAPREGDLIFLASRPKYLDLVLVAKSGLVGPRDLRTSHGQLNPVTRHLLMRILHREWEKLAEDLEQKPLDKGFFKALQTLRASVEKAVADGQRRAAAKRGSPKSKKGDPAADESDRSAFRTSVLVVGRMMFLRFLAQKRWLPGDVQGLVEAFERHGEAFFEKHLVPLWFDVLNVPENERAEAARRQFDGGYPYLNGGLFQPRPRERELRLPGALFDPSKEGSFLRLFRDFEFSLNEHAGSDESLKIDPSLFGKALETFNPDEDRKSEGVHYTPKPIAWALAVEAILTRLERLTAMPRAALEGVLRGERNLTGREADRISEALTDLRIIDPAVGSGVLLWACLEVLLTLDSACMGIAGSGDGYQRGSHLWGQRSRHFVCNCLYGVDISEEAVELTRLRLWLAVALSEDVASPLPDLELNIVRGDSLWSAPRAEASGEGKKAKQLRLGLEEVAQLENRLELVTRQYLRAGERQPEEQRNLRAEVLSVRRALASKGGEAKVDEPPFDWQLAFPHVFRDDTKKGFDVVIANPPYVRIQQLKKGSKERAKYGEVWTTIQRGNADLSYAFVELALRELAAPDGGQIAYIQPNFRHHDAAQTVRDMLVGRVPNIGSRLRLWVDFDDAQVFPTATNYVSLLFAERTTTLSPQAEFIYSNPEPDSWVDSEDLAWMRPPGATHVHPGEGEWLTVPAELRQRVIEAQRRSKRRLGDLAEIHVGVQTSADKIFLFSAAKPAGRGLLECVPRDGGKAVVLEQALVRRCKKGSASEEYYLLFPYDEDGTLLSASVLRKRYPQAWSYLLVNQNALEGRENGKFADDEWYRFGRNQGFATVPMPKVLVPSLLKAAEAILDEEGALAFTASGKGGGGAWALVPKKGVTLQVLEKLVTSQVAWDHINVYGSPQQGGWRGVDREVLEQIPCP